MALGVGTGVDINAMIAKNLGRGDRERASCTVGNAIFIMLCCADFPFRSDIFEYVFQFADNRCCDRRNGNDIPPYHYNFLFWYFRVYVP